MDQKERTQVLIRSVLTSYRKYLKGQKGKNLKIEKVLLKQDEVHNRSKVYVLVSGETYFGLHRQLSELWSRKCPKFNHAPASGGFTYWHGESTDPLGRAWNVHVVAAERVQYYIKDAQRWQE